MIPSTTSPPFAITVLGNESLPAWKHQALGTGKVGAEGPRECPYRKDPEWQLEMGQGHPTVPQEVRGAGREKSSWLGLWGAICVLGKCCLWAEFCGLWREMVAAWSLNSQVPDGDTMCDTLILSKRQRSRGTLAGFPGDGRWVVEELRAAGAAPARGARTHTGALVPGNRGHAPAFSTNKGKSVVTRHTLRGVNSPS